MPTTKWEVIVNVSNPPVRYRKSVPDSCIN
ncbi:hypothetical protein J2X44_003337 [Sphingopyxis sp. BE259]|nr:hypothetical protein [Sphingopyxis sp. BE122]MDR7228801.1 hypothetical protein [Sphingopyxis sp. BE259]